ncbi:MAG: hypothetical protein ACRCZS_22385 [Chroococcidiopsis sp.]
MTYCQTIRQDYLEVNAITLFVSGFFKRRSHFCTKSFEKAIALFYQDLLEGD